MNTRILEKKISSIFGWEIGETKKAIEAYVNFDKRNKHDKKIAYKILNTLIGKDDYRNKWEDVKSHLTHYLQALPISSQLESFGFLRGNPLAAVMNFLEVSAVMSFLEVSIYTVLHFKFKGKLPRGTYLDSIVGDFWHFLIFYYYQEVEVVYKNGTTKKLKIPLNKIISLYRNHPLESYLKFKNVFSRVLLIQYYNN